MRSSSVEKPPVWKMVVDFNTMNQDLWSRDRRVLIGRETDYPLADEGLRVLIGDEDLEVEATLEFDRAHKAWWARPDWSTRHDLSEATVSVPELLPARERQ